MKRSLSFLVVSFVSVLWLAAAAHQADQTIPYPGFRPPSSHSDTFLESLDSASIVVLPTIVRRDKRTAHSFASQARISAFLNEEGMGKASMKQRRVKMLPLQPVSQWDLFQYGLDTVAHALEGYDTGADYTLVMEMLLPVDHVVWGIEVYVLDREGRNAFSFLLNEHHEMFVDAKLQARDSSEKARTQMIDDATAVGLTALQQQIVMARECAAIRKANAREATAGIVHDFEGELSMRADHHGQQIGFVPFSDGTSTVEISSVSDHPTRAGESDVNHVMRLDLDVTGWAGVAKAFENDDFDTWISYDWQGFKGLGFWLHGNNSGTNLYFHVFDNRNPCSTGDDAERYGVGIVDDFSGWKRIEVMFSEMVRAEVGNGAPNDGLGLKNVHGWALGANKTNGPITYYVDDLELLDE